MRYCIDYRNGGMGNTILAHALFSCNQIDLDLSNFFSTTGNAHNINEINKSNLFAKHLIELPQPGYQCILTVVCNDWWEILRFKLSYSKWHESVPQLDNFSKFFPSVHYTINDEKAWQEFYQAYRDPSWPDCDCLADIINLPIQIQEEIKSVYIHPTSSISTEHDFVYWLTICYYNMITNPTDQFLSVKKIELGQYISGNTSVLENICTSVLGWEWDKSKSDQFYLKMLEANQPYLQWLDKIKITVNRLVNNELTTLTDNFDLWEQSLIIAKVCEEVKYDPKNINWDNTSCRNLTNSIYLEKFKRILYGKTI